MNYYLHAKIEINLRFIFIPIGKQVFFSSEASRGGPVSPWTSLDVTIFLFRRLYQSGEKLSFHEMVGGRTPPNKMVNWTGAVLDRPDQRKIGPGPKIEARKLKNRAQINENPSKIYENQAKAIKFPIYRGPLGVPGPLTGMIWELAKT